MEYTSPQLGHPGHQTSISVTFGYRHEHRENIAMNMSMFTTVELKDAIHRQVCNILPNIPRLDVKNAIMRFKLISGNGECHIEQAL